MCNYPDRFDWPAVPCARFQPGAGRQFERRVWWRDHGSAKDQNADRIRRSVANFRAGGEPGRDDGANLEQHFQAGSRCGQSGCCATTACSAICRNGCRLARRRQGWPNGDRACFRIAASLAKPWCAAVRRRESGLHRGIQGRKVSGGSQQSRSRFEGQGIGDRKLTTKAA